MEVSNETADKLEEFAEDNELDYDDVVEQFKFREWGSPHCVDHRYVLKNAVS